jgi:hypothetical protein
LAGIFAGFRQCIAFIQALASFIFPAAGICGVFHQVAVSFAHCPFRVVLKRKSPAEKQDCDLTEIVPD